jgi:hypothetical protein
MNRMDGHHRLNREDRIMLAILTLDALLGIATIIAWTTIGRQTAAGLLVLSAALTVALVIRTERHT